MKHSLIAVALVAVFANAQADDGKGNSYGSYAQYGNVSNTTNNDNSTNFNNANSNKNTNANNNSNENSNRNANSNKNSNLNAQGQQQGQQQGQGQTQSSKSNSAVTGSGNSQSSNSNTSSSGGNTQSNAGNNASTNVNVGGDTYVAARQPVATAYAANIAPTAVCMGSSSGGVQAPGFGVSVGSSWTDKNCELLEQVRAVNALGDKELAEELLNEIPAVAAARKRIADRKAISPVNDRSSIVAPEVVVVKQDTSH